MNVESNAVLEKLEKLDTSHTSLDNFFEVLHRSRLYNLLSLRHQHIYCLAKRTQLRIPYKTMLQNIERYPNQIQAPGQHFYLQPTLNRS